MAPIHSAATTLADLRWDVALDGLNASSLVGSQSTEELQDNDIEKKLSTDATSPTAARPPVVAAAALPATPLVIDMGDTFFNHNYRNRSFVIRNLSQSTLDFTVISAHPVFPSELFFSLSNTALKLFETLSIDAGRFVRVR